MFLRAVESNLYALMRIVLGFLLLLHGPQRLLGIPATAAMPDTLLRQQVVADVPQLRGGALIMVGLPSCAAA